MPLYAYHCTVCRRDEDRIAGIDDASVTCTECGGLMRRTTDDPWQAYHLRRKSQKQGSEREP